MSRPVGVLISDVHYNLQTLPLADAAMRQAIDKANRLHIPLIVAGDLHDTKANMRAECVDTMLATFKLLKSRSTYIIRGNHDAYNEKSDKHALNFLKGVATIIDSTQVKTLDYLDGLLGVYMIPYQHDAEDLRAFLATVPKGSTLIMHQGCIGSKSGDYIQDKSAVTLQDLAGFRVISGHYHTRQSFDLPNGGKLDYIGNPFTLTYGEAQDPPKGFQILMSDGTLEFVPTNLRKHVVMEVSIPMYDKLLYDWRGRNVRDDDLLWLKLSGTREDLAKVTREKLTAILGMPFRLDLIPSDTTSDIQQTTSLTQGPLLDSLIEALPNTSDECKLRLKETWKGLV